MEIVRTKTGMTGLVTAAPNIALVWTNDGQLAYDQIDENRLHEVPRTVTLPDRDELEAFNLGFRLGAQIVVSRA